MAPIKIGLVGLSTSSTATNWAVLAHLPYLQSEHGKSLYEIVALCNSSVESARKSVKHYGLAESVKTYGSPEDLAADPDVELVVCVVGVKAHYNVCLPAVKAGKDVYTELPFATNIKQMQELKDEAEKKGVRTIMGCQGQAHEAVLLIKKMIAEGKIGKPLSTTVVSFSGFPLDKPLPLSFRMLAERDGGANFATIWFLHNINCVLEVFGELEAFSSVMGIDHPTVEIMDPAQSGTIVETVKKECPDNILLQGRFESGTLISYQMRAGKAFPGEPGCRWLINGDKGDILLTSPRGCFDIEHIGIEIKYRQAGQEEAEIIALPEDELSGLEQPAQNVGRLYDAYAKGKTNMYADWRDALKIHKFIDELFRRGDSSTPFGEPAAYRWE
ncbi:NAD-binding Rossmann fold oxidoreductase family protein, partial [Aureobasidium melanogenum]|uniref:NAD-binding Rossmann fold oxidoreductase family protein n=1 Tax=Aureobasidium melanogenum (strain CBS 110374) TaxID=1043003 RepID=A0A074VDC8_AURM1